MPYSEIHYFSGNLKKQKGKQESLFKEGLSRSERKESKGQKEI